MGLQDAEATAFHGLSDTLPFESMHQLYHFWPLGGKAEAGEEYSPPELLLVQHWPFIDIQGFCGPYRLLLAVELLQGSDITLKVVWIARSSLSKSS